MGDEIRADYPQLQEISGIFANQAQAIQEMTRQVQSAYQPLADDGWKGRGSAAFIEEMTSEIFPTLTKFSEVLQISSEVVNQLAETLRRGEEEAANAVKQAPQGAVSL